ncbi:Protein fam72a [Geranomyces variabilis]|uniref:Protein fam72a n=1 Tax=Geranomyces variabilis TaxID=109894 RepID=A0AAD5TSL7_9FUNG|nr:Protein fam72a [Geranomyces variabilis]
MSTPSHPRIVRRDVGVRARANDPDSENELPLASFSRGPLVNHSSGSGPSSSSGGGGPSSSRFGSSQTTTFYPASTGYNGYVYVTTTSGGPDASSSDTPRSAGVIPPTRIFNPSGGSAYAAHFHHHHPHAHHPAATVFRRGSGASRESSSSSLGSSTDSFAAEYGASGFLQQPVVAPAPRTWARIAAESGNNGPTGIPQPRTWARLAAEDEGGPTGSNAEAIRPQFRSKIVCELTCRHCEAVVCRRGMKAILLADMNIELFSTDAPPHGVSLVNDDYQTRNCFCRIRDVACLGCGNVIGYHVTQPCEPCMEACNNGHFWMFHISEVAYADRLDTTGTGKALLWAHLPKAETDCDFEDVYDSMCR